MSQRPVAPWRSSDLEPTEAFEETLEGIRETRRRRRKRRLLATVAIIVVLVLAAATFIYTQRYTTTEIGLDEVTAAFRASRSAPPTESFSVPRTAVNPEQSVESPSTPRSAATTPQENATPIAAELSSLPPEGVYTYSAEGGEQISVFGARHDYPEKFYATVRHLGGCRWEHRNDVIKEHVDIRVLCSNEGRFSQLSQEREVEFFGRRDGGGMTFEPPQLQHAVEDEPGATSTATGADQDGNSSQVHRTYHGRVPMTIGGATVEAIHFRLDSEFSGKVNGTATDEFWISPETGMTLRWDRTVDTLADAAFGAQVRYQEEASFVLQSLTPTT